MRYWLVSVAIVLAAAIVAAAIALKPNAAQTCIGIISADIVRQNISATLDPRDVDAQAARICAGQNG